MECFTRLYVKTADKDLIANLIVKQYLFAESEEECGTHYCFYIMGGGDMADKIKALFASFTENSITFARAAMTGDEDPWVELYTLDGQQTTVVMCEDALFEHISELEPNQINAKPQWAEAHKLGPQKYFQQVFTQWRSGLDSVDLTDIEDTLKQVASLC